VVQREVAPLLLDGRRFCVRQHVLLVVPPLDDDAAVDAVDAAAAGADVRSDGVTIGSTLHMRGVRAYSHRDLIMLQHSTPSSSGDGGGGGDSSNKAAFVQQPRRLLHNALTYQPPNYFYTDNTSPPPKKSVHASS